MTRITNTEHVLLLLRGHLERTQRTRRKHSKTGAVTRKDGQRGVERAQAIAGSQAADEADIERAVIAGLLADEFGDALANDPQFHQVVEQIAAIIGRDDAGQTLLRRAIAQLAGTVKE